MASFAKVSIEVTYESFSKDTKRVVGKMTYGRNEIVEIQWIFRLNIGVYDEMEARPATRDRRAGIQPARFHGRSWIRGLNGFRTVSVWPIQIPRMGLPCDIRIPYVAMPVPRCRMRFMSSAR